MQFCTKCLYNNYKPDLVINDEGVCSACVAYEQRSVINWDAREEIFRELVKEQKKKGLEYDCIIPVSGGKDSFYQTVKCLEFGLRPLLVTAHTCHLSALGHRNLEAIGKLGCDHVVVSFNRKIRSKINKYTLQTIGDISWIEHCLIFNIPIKEATLRNIDLIIYGENPQNEYGGPNAEAIKTDRMTDRWVSEFGGFNGLRPSDMIDVALERGWSVRESDFSLLEPPPTSNVERLFLGQFFPWDGHANFLIAMNNGFEMYVPGVEGSGAAYENLDNHQTGIHDYFRYLKYGYGRAVDIASNLIRRGKMTREQGIWWCKQWDGHFPTTCLGMGLEEILKNIDMTIPEFLQCVNKFANRDLFRVWNDPEEHEPEPLFRLE